MEVLQLGTFDPELSLAFTAAEILIFGKRRESVYRVSILYHPREQKSS
jgi:hypothetical protein